MRGKFFLSLLVCSFCLFSARAQSVVENESSIVFNENSAQLSIVIDSPKPAFDAQIKFWLLDAENAVRAESAPSLKIETGKKTYQIKLPLGDLLQKRENEILWYRLRYEIGDAKGVVSLSQLVREIFELRVIASDNLLSGMNYRSRVRALNPFTNKAVEGVKVNAELELELAGDEDEKLKLAATGESDAEGFALLDFQIPVEAHFSGDGEIKITGRKYGLVREAVEDLQTMRDDYNFLMFTDKPIYQPEQNLNVRGILMKGAEGKTVVPGEEVEFRVEDEEETVIYRERVKTSEYGIAAISWKIPENAKLGDYRIRVKNIDQEEGDYVGYQKVKISRYDLPNFAVNAKATKAFYLPTEKEAEIEVSADYLFGKPVTKGRVRVVRENSREWNWKEQKYEIDEGASREGAADADGKFRARFDLGEDHEDLSDDDWQKYEDLHFTAYFTDLTTNKTEQRRFDVRVTKEPIHVYFIGERYRHHASLPVTSYVSTFYADGTPAICDVELKGREEDGDDEKYRTIERIKTNSYGAGKFRFRRPKFESDEDDLEILIVARDRDGKRGTFGGENNYGDSVEFSDEDALKIETEKTIYKPGEAVKIKIDSTRASGLVYVDLVKGWSVVDSRFVNLKNGKAEIKIPYQAAFQGELTVAAFLEDEDGGLIRTSRGVIYPAPRNLKVEADFDKEIYKPGEAVKVNFGVFDTVGEAIESALGVVVFDKAIEERARTDSDFSGVFSSYSGWLGYGDAFGGVNVKDLNELDLSKPISPELQLVAEVLLYDSYYYPNIYRSRSYDTDAQSVYASFFKKQFEAVEKIFNEHYKTRDFEHPTDDASLRKILRAGGVDFDALRDPWEQNYRAGFETVKAQNIVRIISAGADKTFGTKDDFAVSSAGFDYFTPLGKRIDQAVADYHARTGAFIRDEKTLLSELDLAEFKDRFNRPYQIKFEVSGRFYEMRIRSFGKDGANCECTWGDDFAIWTNRIDYFAEPEGKILKALAKAKKFPPDEAAFKILLRESGLDFDELRDGYNEKLHLVKKRFSRYADKVVIEKVQKYGEETQTDRTILKPVTQEVIAFEIRGKGADRRENTADDTTLAQYEQVLSEQSKDDAQPKPVIKNIVFADGTGAISGTVTDPIGAIVPNATVTATNEETQASRSATSGEDGKFLIANLAAGKYSVKAEAAGFKVSIQTNVPVMANSVAKIDFVLEAGQVSSVVEVTAANETVNTTDASIGNNFQQKQIIKLPVKARNAADLLKLKPGVVGDKDDEDGQTSQKSTPRLREYFPETLFWSPELITGRDGRASLDFKMADNITTWKLYTIASTKQGKIGVAEKEVAAFQSFFVDLEPPRFLTDGDEIHLPTQVRNYTAAKQKVDVSIAPADWFSLLSSEKQNIEVEQNAARNAVFGFRAITPVKDGKQKVTAIAAKDSDAIEKPVTVRPNGQEIVRTESKLFSGSTSFEVDFPANALPRTPKAELKIYPNLMAHVTESVEGLLRRPYGCGEQTISSTYPNLMILKFIKAENSLTRKARKNLQKGYERLLGYQVADGGFSYWGGRDSSDVALTAYALRFLSDARGFLEVDAKTIENARNYLVRQQRADGSFTKKYSWETTEDARRTQLFTGYAARTLAMIKASASASAPTENQAFEIALQKALGYLKTRTAEIDEPYALALYALAAADAGDAEGARLAAERLRAMAKDEGGAAYWNLESNTPFYGWGTAGRIETTALVLQVLLRERRTGDDLVSKATMFLLKSKDRYGVWYSTQTTINVLDAFLASLTESRNQTIAVVLNGEKLKEFSVPADQIEPVVVDLSDRLADANRLEVVSGENSAVMAQVVREHYVDWKEAEISNRQVNASRAVRLDYKCDKPAAKIMETVNCTVEAERTGFRGYGMLLAEIGTPPGADVSRESLEKAFQADWSLSRYEILPDRIVVYMWAKAGGSRFNFSFKPRYGINALTPASLIYDYYNEEAKAIVAPLKFEVK